MKALEPETWTKRSLDQLMLQADRSGDGSLNLEEFMKWMFAEAVFVSDWSIKNVLW